MNVNKFLVVMILLLLYLFYFKLMLTSFTSNKIGSTVSRIKTFINLTRGDPMELENFFKFKELQYEESRQRIR